MGAEENNKKSQTVLQNALKPYQKQIEEEIKKNISLFGEKSELRDACEYALLNGGKRFRPAIVLMISKALGLHADVTYAGLAVEFFHTASLIADDLPCMDNDDERRNKPTLHKVYGETIALLSSYALIAAGYECLTKNAEVIKRSNFPFSQNADLRGLLAIQNASYNTGIFGATGGQYLDLFPKNQTLKTIHEVIHKKTISLFEISFVLGWLFGGGDVEKIEEVKKAAEHFGRAFQIADDIDDMEQDLKKDHKINMAVNFGKEKAFEMVRDEIQQFFNVIGLLKMETQEFKEIAKGLC